MAVITYPHTLQVHDETGLILEGEESLALTGPFTSWQLADAQRGWYALVRTDDKFHWVTFATAVPTDEGWEFMWVREWYCKRSQHQSPFIEQCRADYLEYTGRVYIRAVVRSQNGRGSDATQIFTMQRDELRGVNPTDAVRKGFERWLAGTPYSQDWVLLTWQLITQEAADTWWLQPNLAPVA